ncbi:hypothetical protein ACIBCR_22765 [Micromonospora echinospora]|uniref:hypothetical protein n=1 Tax=Micromonospora echinospora TaxID=1877 RepID=UPI0037BAA315
MAGKRSGKNRSGRGPRKELERPTSTGVPSLPQGAGEQKATSKAFLLAITTGIVVAVASALVLAAGPEIVDSDAKKDQVRDTFRNDPELRYTVEPMDERLQLVLPAGFVLSDKQQRMIPSHELFASGELRAAGAATVDVLTLRVTLEGRRNQDIFVDSVAPVVVERQAPFSGTLFYAPSQGAGTVTKMMFNLDERQPRARIVENYEEGDGETARIFAGLTDGAKPGALFFRENTLTIKDAQEDALLIQSVATEQAVSFNIKIDYRIGGKKKALIIDDEGFPFRVSPLNCVTKGSGMGEAGAGSLGVAAYEDVWQLRDDFSGMERVADPQRFEAFRSC